MTRRRAVDEYQELHGLREFRDTAQMITTRARKLSEEAETLRRLASRLVVGLERYEARSDTRPRRDTHDGNTDQARTGRAA